MTRDGPTAGALHVVIDVVGKVGFLLATAVMMLTALHLLPGPPFEPIIGVVPAFVLFVVGSGLAVLADLAKNWPNGGTSE